MRRPEWEEYFMSIAELASKRSTCLRRQIGAVAVRENQILATGYNGAVSGQPHCGAVGCLREALKIPSGERVELCRAVHAEMNVVCQAASHGVSLQESTLYCTHQPCYSCAKVLINAGVKLIVYLHSYPDELAAALLESRLINLKRSI